MLNWRIAYWRFTNASMNLGPEPPPPPQRLAWADWFALILLALAAPLIAACIQSVWVFSSDYRIYQALIGGAYFDAIEEPGLAIIVFIIGSCLICGIPTFFVLLPFWWRALPRWLVWIGAIAVWTWLCLITERYTLHK